LAEGFRRLPSVDRLLSDERLSDVVASYSWDTVADVVRERVEAARKGIADGGNAPSTDDLLTEVAAATRSRYEPTLVKVINATGVLIHTNLGRAPLSKEALLAATRAGEGYSNLELDLGTGERGSRHAHLETLLQRLTGAEAGLAVNNNAAAVMLGLSALAEGKEVIVSRGEAVEIGGGFRIPDILEQSGARLREVGTTNRTYLKDFENAVTDETGAYLRVHPSNFRVSGFTHAPTMAEMAESAARRGLPLLHDIGSGCLLETKDLGMVHEPTPQESVAEGADLVFFSGDKLLGGPQAGIVVGKSKCVSVLKSHPLVRAMRIDKGTMAALQVTLLHYIKGEATEKLPIWRMLSAPLQVLERRAKRWAREAGEAARVADAYSTIGGGSLPGELIPSRVLAIRGTGVMLEATARRLREGPTPVMTRIEKDALVLDPRTVAPEEDRAVMEALRLALTGA
jgi:L-seryl-tRNA(Ser) seleniumtransferase